MSQSSNMNVTTPTAKPQQPVAKKVVIKRSKQLYAYLNNHYLNSALGQKSTNTRIKNEKLDIKGGNYYIPDVEYDEFLKMYHREFIVPNEVEYLTESQLDINGPILIDIDFNFDPAVDRRLYQYTHIVELIDLYIEKLNNIYSFDPDNPFYIYVLEKESIRREQFRTKDGIHIIIGIQCDRITQQILRKMILEDIPQLWDAHFPIIQENKWEDVFDYGISSGSNNWQLYGSTKPGYAPYSLTSVHKCETKIDNGDIHVSTEKINFDVSVYENFAKLSARYQNHTFLAFDPEFIKIRNHYMNEGIFSQKPTGGKVFNPMDIPDKLKPQNAPVHLNELVAIEKLCSLESREQLFQLEKEFLQLLEEKEEYTLLDAHEYTMILPESYYSEGSYNKWISVGWALRNINFICYFTWICLSAKWPKFQMYSIRDLYTKWSNEFKADDKCGKTIGSIKHWAKTEAHSEYSQIKAKYAIRMINSTLDIGSDGFSKKIDFKKLPGCGDTDIAKVLKELYGDEFVCVSVSKKVWFMYKNHRWQFNDNGNDLRKKISEELPELYTNQAKHYLQLQYENDSEKDEQKNKLYMFLTEKALAVANRLKKTVEKDHILKEAMELFYDPEFEDKLDSNPYLLGFNNGVIDFKEKRFRAGRPDDYITKTTKTNYTEFSESDPVYIEKSAKLIQLFESLFPIPAVRKYMWDFTASILIGKPKQIFTSLLGVGANGKSVYLMIMNASLGEYAGELPVKLLTEKDVKVGQTNTELLELKGLRFAAGSEAEDGAKMYTSSVKLMTSGLEPLAARGLYDKKRTHFIPQFTPVLATNYLLDIVTRDEGIWRRIRVVDFISTFVANPDPNIPYQFKIIDGLEEIVKGWLDVFMYMLVKRAYITDGNIAPCDEVTTSSMNYRKDQDILAEFVDDKIKIDPRGEIKKDELANEYAAWCKSNGYFEKSKIKIKEVQDYISKKFVKVNKNKWKGISIKYPNYDDDDDDDIEDGQSYTSDSTSKLSSK